METKEFNGKALYRPKGRSGEYARWAINFYNGCTGGCEYCYNKRFPLLSGPTPMLKVCFNDEEDAYNVATSEILQNKDDIVRDGGVFLSFVSDPCGEHALKLTLDIVKFCSDNNIPVTVLTKRADWVLNPACKSIAIYNAFRNSLPNRAEIRKNIAFGFTLTGHDEIEPGCDCNEDRITAMEDLHNEGFRTWASIEPIIDLKPHIV